MRIIDFNKYQFIEELNKFIIDEIKNGNCQSSDDYYTLMHEEIDRACIYYADCWAICAELSATDFTVYDDRITSIDQLAYHALYEYSINEMDVKQFDELLETLSD